MKQVIKISLGISVLVPIIIPIAFYVYQFGFGTWDKHEDWAHMGSYFGGVLAPIITTISLVFLGVQIRLQTQQRNDELQLHVCSECELDIVKYLPKMKTFIEYEPNQKNIESLLEKHAEIMHKGNKSEAIELVHKFIAKEYAIWEIWLQIDASLRALQRLKQYKFKRMQTLILSELDIQHLVLLESIRERIVEESSPTCFFSDIEEVIK